MGLFGSADRPTKKVEFYGGPWDGETRDVSPTTVAYTAQWCGESYLYQQRAYWGQSPVLFDFVRKLGL